MKSGNSSRPPRSPCARIRSPSARGTSVEQEGADHLQVGEEPRRRSGSPAARGAHVLRPSGSRFGEPGAATAITSSTSMPKNRRSASCRAASVEPRIARSTSAKQGPIRIGSSARSSSRTARRAARRAGRGGCRRRRRRSPPPAPRRRHGCELQIVQRVVFGQRPGQRIAGHRAVVLGDALQRLPGQVQPVELGIVAPAGDDAERLRVVVEPAVGRHQRVQRVLAGMAEGRVAEVVRQRHRLGSSSFSPSAPARCAPPAPPRSNGSAGCGSNRPRARRRPASCASAAGRRWNG
jgi:hypothetical protein